MPSHFPAHAYGGAGTRVGESWAARDRGESATLRAGEGASVPPPQPPGRRSGRFLHGLVDQIRRTGRRLLQGGRGQVRVELGHLGVRVPQDLLDLVQSPPAVHEHRGVGMSQIVDANMPQAGRVAQSVPDLLDGGVRLSRFPVDEHVLELALGVQPIQHTDGAVIQRHGAHLARFRVGGRNAPDTPFDIDVLP